MHAALTLERVCKTYDRFEAVRDVSFSARPGQILGFLGPNGAGKASTLRMILGLSEPTSGQTQVLGAANARLVRDRIGFLPEERGLYRRMTAQEAIAFFGRLKGLSRPEAMSRALDLLEGQGLGEAARRPVRALSKGMAQKVQLLSAIVHRPDLVILDEPFSGLDPVNQQALETIIRGLARQGATVVFSTHVMQHAERLCDHVILIAKGRKVFDGSVAQATARVPRILALDGISEPGGLAGLAGVIRIEPGEAAGLWLAHLGTDANASDIVRQVIDRGLSLTRFEIKEPSLHDAFILLTQPEGQA